MAGTKDLPIAVGFYEPIFSLMGLDQCWRDEQCASWGKKDDVSFPRFFTGYPFNGEVSCAGNGSMTAFLCDAAIIDELHVLALKNRGTCEGAPGLRPRYGEGFYAPMLETPMEINLRSYVTMPKSRRASECDGIGAAISSS